MKRLRATILCGALALSGFAQAEIYKHVDKDGRVTYSSEPVKGARKLQLEPLNTVPAAKAKAEAAAREFQRVDPATQTRRDGRRQRILEDELASEQTALEEAREKLKVAQDTPMVYRNASGQTFRNVAQYEENVRLAQEAVKTHEDNIKALQTELANLK
ncbi:MAG: DUF4124 domain-containing protein [Gallionella sp.]|nr:DUF4124 domain-containing protein [Gallionella sp.]OIO12583.1 MAG: hypothetical protein AUJ80_00610 [Gallionellaceae bacterium CG1_02_60_325]PIR09866.1 MAG: DUF4124 domain-containing protein [Gallionellaceae bacterium CG11_big_fil_rev_8_21_14_0_20_60_62]PIV48069.1 MAG: DUF4124 domain-containing protein [Gallionellaceae bacterium CG02_land_8_20_14_3_00_60_115]PIY07001.1 MAG: DUF4124 domain-containing protein [Gallionellaceae bacterium CG_4_10_14_3_um_filter_60_1069]PJC04389.1 MAG: DUF4124 do